MSSFAMRVNNGNLSIADYLEKLNKVRAIWTEIKNIQKFW